MSCINACIITLTEYIPFSRRAATPRGRGPVGCSPSGSPVPRGSVLAPPGAPPRAILLHLVQPPPPPGAAAHGTPRGPGLGSFVRPWHKLELDQTQGRLRRGDPSLEGGIERVPREGRGLPGSAPPPPAGGGRSIPPCFRLSMVRGRVSEFPLAPTAFCPVIHINFSGRKRSNKGAKTTRRHRENG